ncbi:hypothetical protein Tco_1207224, partial [Tanacetum coccineum]
PPPPDENRGKTIDPGDALSGLGLGRAAWRGIPSALLVVQVQPGLSGLVRRVGGPAPSMVMQHGFQVQDVLTANFGAVGTSFSSWYSYSSDDTSPYGNIKVAFGYITEKASFTYTS